MNDSPTTSLFQDFLFVDSSGWLTYIDKNMPYHTEALEKIQSAGGLVLTYDYALRDINNLAKSRVDRKTLSTLTWQIWDGQYGKLLKTTEEEEFLAWQIFKTQNTITPSFSDCLNVVVLRKHRINHWLSYSQWMPKTVDELQERIISLSPTE